MTMQEQIIPEIRSAETAHSYAELGKDPIVPVSTSHAIAFPKDSPMYELSKPREGYQGKGSVRPTDVTLERAQGLWEYSLKICADSKPHVYDGPEGSVCFLWKKKNRRLDIFIYEGSPFRAEYSVDEQVKGKDADCLECFSLFTLERVVREFINA